MLDDRGDFEYMKHAGVEMESDYSYEPVIVALSRIMQGDINGIAMLATIYQSVEKGPHRGFLFCNWLKIKLAEPGLKEEFMASVETGRRIGRRHNADRPE